MISLTNEKSIAKKIVKMFENQGWINRTPKRKIHGVDIKLWHPEKRRYWFIEVKRSYTTKNKGSQTYVNTATMLGQIIFRMHQKKSARYGIGTPNTQLFRRELSKIPLWVKARLKLYIFLLNQSGTICIVKPSAKISECT